MRILDATQGGFSQLLMILLVVSDRDRNRNQRLNSMNEHSTILYHIMCTILPFNHLYQSLIYSVYGAVSPSADDIMFRSTIHHSSLPSAFFLALSFLNGIITIAQIKNKFRININTTRSLASFKIENAKHSIQHRDPMLQY